MDWVIRMIIADISLITAVFICIEVRIHISATSPVLISNSKEIQFPWFLMSVFLTEISHRGNTLECDIFYPFRHFLNCSASQVTINISFAVKLLTEFKKFMCTKAVILYHTAPVCVDHFFTCFLWSDTVFPVIFICKTSARPAQYRNFDIFQCFNNIGTHSVHVRNIGIFSYIESFINTSSQMLRKLSLDFLIDF